MGVEVIDGPIVIELQGRVPGKKNNWHSRKGGGVGITDPAVKAAIDRLAMQIPGYIRDLKLEHPEIEVLFTYTTANWDTDNAYTTLLDILKNMGVIVDDNIAHFNGKKTIHPAIRGEFDCVQITLIPAAASVAEGSPRYTTRRRPRTTPLFAHAIKDPDSTELEDMDGLCEWER